jgi:hypothetical protein
MKSRLTDRAGWKLVIVLVICVALLRDSAISDARLNETTTDNRTSASTPLPLPPSTEPSTSAPRSTEPPPTAPASTAPPPTAPPPTAPRPVEQQAPIASNFDVNSYLTTGGVVPASTEGEPSGAFRTLCQFSHLAYDDPIVYPGQPGKSHLHMFFGNASANADSTYASLRASGDGTCQGGPINRTGYWAPAMLNAEGKVVVPDFLTVYYKGEYEDADGIRAIVTIPVGLRMIAGYNMVTGSPDTHFDWYCETNQIKQQTIPHCATGERVGILLRFPECWDGVNLDSADHRSHLAYISYDTGVAACPADHPVHIAEVSLAAWWTHDGNSENWSVSSDHMVGMIHANGSTFHSDWFGAWDPEIQNRWFNECIHALRGCIDGELGDGSQLVQVTPYAGPMLLDPPPLPP